MADDRPAGIDCVGNVTWGAHLCEFYSKREELTDTLGPYLAAGLQQDEFCLWVTSDPSGVEGAKTGLRKAVADLDRYLEIGQIEIWDFHDWYLRGGHFDADRAFGQCLELEAKGLERGFKGLRATGDMDWLEKGDWPNFMAYEAEVNRVLGQHRVIALCTYPLDRCTADGVLEIVRNHQFALGRIAGEWETIESSSLKIAKEELRRLNNNLHDQMEQRSQIDRSNAILKRLSAHLLEEQDEERRRIAAQLHEGTAQNVCAIDLYLEVLQKMTPASLSEVEFIVAKCHTLCEQSLEQILALSRSLHVPIHDHAALAARLRCYIEDFTKRSFIQVEFEAKTEIGRLPPEMEDHLFLIAQEGLSNILRHSGSLNAIVRLERQGEQVILQMEDFGRGMPATVTAAVSGGGGEVGLGILGMQVRLQKIGGHLEIRSSSQGTLLTASVRLS